MFSIRLSSIIIMIHRESPLTDTKSLPYDLMEALNFAVLYRLHK